MRKIKTFFVDFMEREPPVGIENSKSQKSAR